MQNPAHALVIGLGNILLQDEGLGVRAVERLAQQYILPEQVEWLDGGTLGLDLLPRLDGVTDLLIADAVQTESEPGSLVRLEGDEIQAALSLKMSMHQVGLQDLLSVASLQGRLPRRVVVWGIVPAELQLGLELTPTVAGRLDALVQALAGELRRWGFDVSPRAGAD